jgi:hypothetical protein
MSTILILISLALGEYVEIKLNSKVSFGWEFEEDKIRMVIKVFNN